MLLLHLSDLHFGNKNRFANDKPSDLGRAFHRALQAARKERHIPDTMAVSLVIVTGDIVESGLPSEFRAALEFLVSLSEEMGLPHDHFVFLPGNHDISWADCRIVRAARDGEKFPAAEFESRLNTEKLANYRAFLSAFYGKPVDDDNLAELENVRSLGSGGWLRDFPDLRLSIAALNTSEREHDVLKGGFLSPDQAQALMTFWREDPSSSRLKILALHHNPVSTTDANRDWVLTWLRDKEKAAGESVPMSADVFEHYIADIAGFIGSEHLPKIVEDTCPHAVLHGHHHDQGRPNSWHWKKNGNAPVLSVGSFGLNKDQLPGDAPLSCQFLRFVLPPEPTAPRLIAIPLIYDGRFRLEGDVLVGAFRAEVASRAAYDQPLPLPKGWKVEAEPAPEPVIVDASPPRFLGKHEHLCYDRQPVYARKLSDLDQELIMEFLAKPLSQEQNAGLKREKNGGSPNLEQQLEHLHCMYEGRPTLGALLCFAPSQILTDKAGCCTLQMAIHDASERGGDNTSIAIARGNLLHLFERGMTWLTGGSVLRRQGQVGSKSRDDFEIPARVLREALANALVHRDYETIVLQGQPTRIDVYPDKVEVTSYGRLLDQVHLEQLNSPDQTLRPFRRNEAIACVFQCMTGAELNASGIHRMRRLMTEAGLALPLFRAGDDFVCVTLARPFELSSARVVVPPSSSALRSTRKVFISSTGELSVHRKAAQDACLRAGMIPIMWEEFPLSATDSSTALKHMIDEADVYICILGIRYGALLSPEGISGVEAEFNRAVDRGVPILVFTMHKDHPVTIDEAARDSEGRKRLAHFKERVLKDRLVIEFKSPEDLRGRIIEALATLPDPVKRFRVGLSFAGEKRPFVAQVAALLAKQFGESSILYDKFHEAEFARYDLSVYLPRLYGESDLVVAVLAKDYNKKTWTGLEWNTINGLMEQGRQSDVMLCRFDYTEVKGLHENAGFVELDDKTPEQFATLILERLALNEGHSKDHYIGPSSAHAQVLKTSIPHNLPTLQPFFGRELELRKIADALDHGSRTWGVLIDGPGGMGKTSLAVRAAYDASPDDFNRIIFISLKTRELDDDGMRDLSGFMLCGLVEILNELARELDCDDIAKAPEDQRPRLLLDALRGTQTLLVLDNLESLVKRERDQLFTFVKKLPPGCKAILTSRGRIGSGAEELILEKLSQEAALATLAELAIHNPLLAQTTEAERLVLYRETGGKPLLLRWAAGQLGRGHCLTFTDALHFIRSCPPENDPLEFIFGDLVEDFDDAETQALCALTYFNVPASVEHVAALAGLLEPDTDRALRKLSVRSLAVPTNELKTFTLVTMVADFLRQKMPEVTAKIGDRLEKRAYALIIENGYDKHERFPALEAAWPGIAPALPLFLAGDNARLQTVCDALHRFLEFQGRWDEWLALSEKSESKAVAAADYLQAGWRASHIGYIHFLRQQAEAVLTCAERAAAHWERAKAGARERGIAIRLRGIGHQLKAEYPAAIAAYREALDLHRSLAAESSDVASSLNSLAEVERLSGDLVAAEGHYREALSVARFIGHIDGVANFTGNLAELALDREDWTDAETLAREALSLAETVHRQELIASNNHRLAQALVRQGKIAEALPHARHAVEIYIRLDSPDLKVARATLRECEQ